MAALCLYFSGKSRDKNYAVELEFNGNIIPEVIIVLFCY